MAFLLAVLPNDKNSDRFKLIVFADDKIDVTQKLKLVLGKIENIVEKRKKCWLPAFSPFSYNVFKRLISRSLTVSSIYTHFNTLKKKALGKHCGKSEIAQNE